MIAARPETGSTDPDRRPFHRAEDLLRGDRETRIRLGDEVYVLRLTRAGKLILTK